jgi:hypothetical protein
MYTPDGYMSAQPMKPGRRNFCVRRLVQGYSGRICGRRQRLHRLFRPLSSLWNSHSAKRLQKVFDKVVRMLQSYRQTEQILRRVRSPAFAGSAMLDQALRTT